jgi:hypothetical protein
MKSFFLFFVFFLFAHQTFAQLRYINYDLKKDNDSLKVVIWFVHNGANFTYLPKVIEKHNTEEMSIKFLYELKGAHVNAPYDYFDSVAYPLDSLPSNLKFIYLYAGIEYIDTGFTEIDTLNYLTLEQESINPVEALIVNPVGQFLEIQSEDNFDKLEIFDLQGRLMYSDKYRNHINVSFLNKGMYMLRLSSEKGILSKKIWKE